MNSNFTFISELFPKSLFSGKKRAEKDRHAVSALPVGRFRAGYDAAKTTRDNERHWQYADSLSADEQAAPEVRKVLRERSRYEIGNNSYARGLVRMLANDTIGTGPRLQILGDNEEFNDSVERDFGRWASAVKLAKKLRLMRIARCQDGETFAILSTNPELNDPVKLDLRVIEADRVCGDRVSRIKGKSVRYVDGIAYDEWDNPVSYQVLNEHPGSGFCSLFSSRSCRSIPAEYMLHLFSQERPEQHRGIPELSAALPLFAQLRRYNMAALSSAEAAADFSAILYTDAPPNGESDPIEPMDAIELERNMMLTVPAGWKMAQLDAKQPTANHAEFVKIILSEIARCAVSTYGAVSGDYSGHNYASGRLDNQLYRKGIGVDRAVWESDALDPVFRLWYREYALLHHLDGSGIPDHTWFWDGFSHVDPTKEAAAQQIRLANHTTTLAAECARDGLDYMAVLRQRRKELRLMQEWGIPEGVQNGGIRQMCQVQNTEYDGEKSKNDEYGN